MKRAKVVAFAFVFMLVLLAASAQNVAAASRSDTLRSYINGRYDAERGGYSPPSDSVVRVSSTYGAILALNELGLLNNRPPPINLTKALNSLVLRQWDTNGDNALDRARYGGFSEYLAGPVTMDMTYMGIILLNMLKEQSDYPGITKLDINSEAVLVFVNKTQTDSGGFSSVPEKDPDIISTYQALYIINFLDTYDTDLNAWTWLRNETATLDWINSCRTGVAYKVSPEDSLPSVSASAAAVMALGLLPSVSSVPGLQDTENWILARQVMHADESDYSGGFEEGEGTGDPNFVSTYYALKVLDHAGAISLANSTAAISFILNCQTEDGSWGFIPDATSGNLVFAGQACELLNILGNAANILGSAPNPFASSGVVIDWRTIVIVGILFVALIIALVALRID